MNWIEEGWKPVAGTSARFPSFAQARPRDAPESDADWKGSCDEPTLNRWYSDWYRFPAFHYKSENLPTNGNTFRYPSCLERERLLGFNDHHTRACATTRVAKEKLDETEVQRLCLLADSLDTHVAAFLISHLLAHNGFLESPSPISLLRGESLWSLSCSGGPRPASAQTFEIIREISRCQIHRGREIRNLTVRGPPGLMPRTAIPAAWWSWRVVVAYSFRTTNEHINAKELCALLSSVQWRLRSKSNVASRGLHVLDSAVVIGCVSRGRSPAASLRPILEKSNALMLAGSLVCLLGYVRTEDNPADKPSRLPP